jgi:uncharacterized protein YjeT (DUF2065 family)
MTNSVALMYQENELVPCFSVGSPRSWSLSLFKKALRQVASLSDAHLRRMLLSLGRVVSVGFPAGTHHCGVSPTNHCRWIGSNRADRRLKSQAPDARERSDPGLPKRLITVDIFYI